QGRGVVLARPRPSPAPDRGRAAGHDEPAGVPVLARVPRAQPDRPRRPAPAARRPDRLLDRRQRSGPCAPAAAGQLPRRPGCHSARRRGGYLVRLPMTPPRVLLVEIGTPAELPPVTPPAPRPPSSWTPNPRPSPGLAPPTGLAVEVMADAAKLTWTRSTQPGALTVVEGAPDV